MPSAERNDFCPCGSGKKYKKCHLDADLASDRERSAEERPGLEPTPLPEPVPELTGHEQRWNVLFKQLGTASPDEMLRLARAYIEAEPEFDEEDAFSLMIEFLEPALAEARRGEELSPLIELIRQRHPSAYETNVGYFVSRALGEAYESGQDPAPHLLEWARTPTRQFEYFERAIQQALFHGRESLALQALETGKQALLDDEDFSRQFAAQIGMFGNGAYQAAAAVLALPYWRPYLLEVGGDGSRLSDPAQWLESRAGREERVGLAKHLDGLAARALDPTNGSK